MGPTVRRVTLAALVLATTALVAVGLASPASAASGWTSLSSGGAHTCGIRGGRIYCWGYDEYGQLGDGTAGGSRATPAPILSSATDWTSVSAGSFHTCAIRVGRIACWGYDGSGQLGDGTAGVTADPIPNLIASGATDWKAVSAGDSHTCATRAGRVACWGGDQNGQLGDGTAGGTRPYPALIASGATDWTSVSAGSSHTCGIRSGRVACWGGDGAGQLGDGTAASPQIDPSPGLIASGATDWTSVSAGLDHTCAIRAGRVACWGGDGSGQLGDGTAGSPVLDPTPGLISSGATDWTSVSAGDAHTCATRVGRVACWGYDGSGQLGDGTAGSPQIDPSPGFIVSGATDWKRVDAGGSHTCAIRATLLACWGYDSSGQLGDGTAGPGPDPIPNVEVS